ncbi:MAG: hypothetical protein AAF340_13310 [Pseudomonadota bacterium]
MIETHLNPQANAAQKAAHEIRGEAVASLFRAIPKIVSSLRHKS